MNLKMTIRALLASPLALGLGAAHAAPQYIITDLGTLGGKLSQAPRLNEAGQVAGFSSTELSATLKPFLWQEGLGLQPIATLGGNHAQALNINDSGQVVGVSYLAGDTATRGFIAHAGTVQELPTLGGNNGRALAINGNGVVTGAAAQANGNELGFVWQDQPAPAADTLVSLRTFNANGLKSQGNDINNAGLIVGFADNAARTFHAAAWSAPYTGLPTDLGTLGGTNSEAYAANENGQVTGYANVTGDTGHRAFLWRAGSAMRDLGRLGTGNFSEGFDINAAGDVVGYSTTTGDAARRAVIRRAAGTAMEDLNGLVLPNQGWLFTEAYGLNNAGQIVGLGTLTRTDTAANVVRVERHAFLLTPDKVLPTITCPAAIRTTGTQPASIGTAVATDNLDPNPTVTNDKPATFPNGDTTVTWTATDAAGNRATCTQVVTIAADTTPPQVSAKWTPATPDGTNGWYITAPSLAWSVTDAESAISSRVGCVNSTLAADTADQSYNCSATSTGGTTGPVTTTAKLDRVAPAVSAPAAVTADATGFETAAVSFANPTATDALSGVDTASLSCSPASGSTFTLGSSTVSCTGKDLAGNTGTASFTVTVRDPSPPVITPTITGPAGNNGWYRGATSVAFSVTDAQSTVISKTGCDPATFGTDGANQSVTCSAQSAGGTSTLPQSVNVDATPPSLTYTSQSLVVEATGPTGAIVTYPNVTVNDATSGPAAPNASCVPASGSTLPLGPSTINCSASDRAGNPASGSISVSVVDTTKPTLSLPAGASVSTTDAGGAVVTFAASASDLVSGSLVPTCLPVSGSIFPVGVTPVSCSATDAAGNSATGGFNVTVTQTTTPPADTTAPVLTLPAGITIEAANGVSVPVSYTASALDNVDGPLTPVCTPASGTTFPVGVTAVTCSAVDAAGNKASGSFNVTVTQPAPPPPATTTDLAITGSVSNTSPRKGDNVTYSFVMRNIGTAAAQDVTFTDVLPRALRFSSLTTTPALTCVRPGTGGGGTIRCTSNSIAPGASATLTVVARTDASGLISNPASVTTTSADTNPANNNVSVTLTAR